MMAHSRHRLNRRSSSMHFWLAVSKMTRYTAHDALAAAYNEVGRKEKPAGSNSIKYNMWYYDRDVRAPWCAAFVSWLFRDHAAMIRGKFARTDAKAKALAKQGLITDVAGACKGAIVFFAFEGPKYQGRWRGIHHVGIWTGKRKADGRYVCIEGNTSASSNDNGGAVMIRYRSPKYIAAVYNPAFDKAEPKPTPAPAPTKPSAVKKSKKTPAPKYRLRTTIKRGSKGEPVKQLQRRLKSLGYDVGKVDGVMGAKTERALKLYQRRHKLTADGICGRATAKQLGWRWG